MPYISILRSTIPYDVNLCKVDVDLPTVLTYLLISAGNCGRKLKATVGKKEVGTCQKQRQNGSN